MATKGNMLADSTNTSDTLVYIEGTFTPTITFVGGAGNVAPVYTTNTGRYTRIGNRVFVDILLTGDGGDEGAGTGAMNIALPFAAGASDPAGYIPRGQYINGSTDSALLGRVIAGSKIELKYQTSLTATAQLTGADQNNTARQIKLQFSYEV